MPKPRGEITKTAESDLREIFLCYRLRPLSVLTVITWEILTTLSFFRWPSPFRRGTFPGALARLRLEVKAQTTMVLILL